MVSRHWASRPIVDAPLSRSLVLVPSTLEAAVGLVRGSCYMLVHSDRSHRIQQILERVIVVALFVYVVCSVISISAMQTAYVLALVAWAIRIYLQGDARQLRLPLLMLFSAFLLASVLATVLA